MIGVLLTSIGTFFDEVATSFGKAKVEKKQLGLYSFCFINNFFTLVFLLIIIAYKGQFLFSFASLPTFIPRVILEVIITFIAFSAIIKADRSTFGYIRVLTIPILLIVDIILSYKINNFQLAGIIIIIMTLFFIFSGRKINKKGAMMTLVATLLAVATVSLYKYNISHFNSVEAEQAIVYLVILIFVFFIAVVKDKENPFSYFKKAEFLIQGLVAGLAGPLISYAYNYAPASVIMAAKRSWEVGWSVLSGKVYFKEENILVKLVYLVMLILGIVLLVL